MAKETAEYSLGGESRGVTIAMGGAEGEDIRHAAKDRVEIDTDELDAGSDDAGGEHAGAEADLDAEAGAGAGDDGRGDQEDSELPAFDPEDPEVAEQYDAKFLTEDGTLDVEGAFSQEYFANVEKGVDGLNESTYEYLASKGISKATVKQIEAMAATAKDAKQADVPAHDSALFEIAGGPDELSKALTWGKSGGYSAEQQKRFNTITSGKDLEAKQEAVEALMSRYRRANPPQKPSLPRRDATKAQGRTQGAGAKPFDTRAEMREFRSQLRDNDTKGWAAYNARLKVSNFKD